MTLELIVKYQIFEVLKHPAVQRLIDLKWDRYGFSGACIALLLKFVFIITWTALMTIVDWEKRHIYNFPQDWWRIALSFVCITEVFLYIGVELRNIIKSQRNLISWKKKEKQKFLQDKKFCHPRYPLALAAYVDEGKVYKVDDQNSVVVQEAIQVGGMKRKVVVEATFIEKELDNLAATKSYCCIDFWYFYGWLVVVLLLAVIFTHVADVILQWNQVIAWLHLQFVAITLPPLWLWNLKHFKPFRYIGPFVSMIGSIIPIIFKFLFIYTQFFIPYAFAYYLIFGGFNELSEFNTLSSCLFTTFRISVIDHYNYNAMLEHDALMTYVLVGTFIGLEAVLAVNLLIAMLIHTFRGDNLSEKLYMQRASILLYLEKLPYFSAKTEELHNYIHAIADPIAEPFYTEEDILEESYLKYAVFEIK
uniref:uncharacterized protein n=1 Tax=Pristiophorus japonicus TaxID=55135 RepID=UPI00398F8263